MSIENETIGFLCNILKDITYVSRQHNVLNYKNEKKRTELITQELNCSWYRFDPTIENFDFSKVVNEVIKLVVSQRDKN